MLGMFYICGESSLGVRMDCSILKPDAYERRISAHDVAYIDME